MLAVPATSFYSVVTSIEDKLFNYDQNPETVVIANVNTSSQPETAL